MNKSDLKRLTKFLAVIAFLGIFYKTAYAVSPDAPEIHMAQSSQYLTEPGTFTFTGETESNTVTISNVQWRPHIDGQDPEDGWHDCTADDDTFDTDTEGFTCVTDSVNDDDTYNYDIRSVDDQDVVSEIKSATGLMDTAKRVDAWLSFDNLNDGGFHAGDSRTFDAVTFNGLLDSGTGPGENGTTIFDRNSASEYIIPDTNSYFAHDGNSGNFSVKLIVKPYSSIEGQTVNFVGKEKEGSDAYSWLLGISDTGSVFASVFNSVQREDFGNNLTKTLINYDEWNTIVFSWDASTHTFSIKVNDNPAATAVWAYDAGLLDSADPLYVGCFQEQSCFSGEMDNIYIYREGDSTPPIAQISTLPDSSRVTTASPEFTLSFSDNSGVASAEYMFTTENGGDIDSQPWVSIDHPEDGDWGGTTESATISASDLSDGAIYLYVRTTDIYGNRSVSYENNTWIAYPVTSPYVMPFYLFTIETVDSTAPRIYANAIMPDPTVDRKPAVRGYIKDYVIKDEGETSSNIASISYSVDGGDFTSSEPIDGNFDSDLEDFYIKIPSDLTLGAHSIQIRATDASGNSTQSNTPGTTNGDYILNFDITAKDDSVHSHEVITNITFDTHDLQDSIFTDAVWGNSIVRLRQQIAVDSETDYEDDSPERFGSTYGEVKTFVQPASDGNLWVGLNNGNFAYYNISTKSLTEYQGQGLGSSINKLLDFETGGHRYVAVSFFLGSTTKIYDLNGTPEDTGDDPTPADFADKSGFDDNKMNQFEPYALDTRGTNDAIYGIIRGTDNDVIRVDLNGTPMDVTDDTYTTWGHAQGVEDDLSHNHVENSSVSLYFDQDSHMFILGSYALGLFVCDDKDTPADNSDDTCSTPYGPEAIFSIIKDSNGSFWLGGDPGLYRLDINATTDTSDDTVQTVWTADDINGEQIADLKWIPGTYPVGDEIWTLTRTGRLRALEYNNTYTDITDDTAYHFKIPQFEYRSGSATAFYFSDNNTVYTSVGGVGIIKSTITRSFADTNVIELYPTPPANLLEVDHVTLSDIVGAVSSGSSHTLGDLLTYEISNDAGVTWHPATLGTPINFTTSDYKLKIRITLHKGSTPIIQSIKLSYMAQPAGTIGSDEGPVDEDNSSCTETKPGGKPLIYRIEPIGNTNLKIYFNPINDPKDKYEIAWGTIEGIFSHSTKTSEYGSGSYTIEGLHPSTDYFVKIRALNSCAKGDWSDTIKGTSTVQPVLGGIETEPQGTTGASTSPSAEVINDLVTATESTPSAPPVLSAIPENKPKLPNIFGSILSFISKNKTTGDLGFAGLIALGLALSAATQISNLLKAGSAKNLKLLFPGFWKYKRVPWGVVYDSKTKRPLDPVILSLISQAGKTYQAVTDMFGRYSFIANPGKYTINATKTNYKFPTDLINSQLDELVYSDILLNNEVYVRPNETINLNIPMDAQQENWNEQEKSRMGGYNAPNKFAQIFKKLSYYGGMVWSIGVLYVSPSILNLAVFLAFTIFAWYVSVKEKYEACGYIVDKDGNALAGLAVDLVRVKFPNIGKRSSVTDNWGRYAFLVNNGEYKIVVSRIDEGSKRVIYESDAINVTNNLGVITRKIVI